MQCYKYNLGLAKDVCVRFSMLFKAGGLYADILCA